VVDSLLRVSSPWPDPSVTPVLLVALPELTITLPCRDFGPPQTSSGAPMESATRPLGFAPPSFSPPQMAPPSYAPATAPQSFAALPFVEYAPQEYAPSGYHDQHQPSSGFAPQSLTPQSLTPQTYGSQDHLVEAPGFQAPGFPSEAMQAYPQQAPLDYQPQVIQQHVAQGYQSHGFQPQTPPGHEPAPQGYQHQASYGYEPQPQGYQHQASDGYEPQPQGYQHQAPQGFQPQSQGYQHQAPQGYRQQAPQGFQPQSQGFQPQSQGYQPQAPQGFQPQSQGYQPQAPQGFLPQSQGYDAQSFPPQGLPMRVPRGSRSQGAQGYQPPPGFQPQAAQGYQPEEPIGYQSPQGYQPHDLPMTAPLGYEQQAYMPPLSQGYPPQASHEQAPQGAQAYAPQHVQPQTYPQQGFVALGSSGNARQPQHQDQGYPAQNGHYVAPSEPANAYPTQGLIAPGIAPTTGFITPGYEAFQTHSQQQQAEAQPVMGRVTNRIASSTPGHGAVLAPNEPVRWIGPEPTSPQGYSDAPSRRTPAAPAAPQGLVAGPRWDTRDDAPRYAPPGSEEIETDPFGLLALPDQHHYRGPREVPDDATAGVLLGVLSFFICLVGFVGYRRARRAQMLISSAPKRFRGGWLASLGIALNLIGPVASIIAFYLWRQS
jgi:hypothetical protein